MMVETMCAAVRAGLMGYTLSFRDSHPAPSLPKKTTEVLLEVRSAAINPIDYKAPRSMLGSIYGLDVSGVVKSVGGDGTSSSSGLKVGDEVFGRASSGSLAEYALASDAELAPKPDFLSHDEAAALPTAYLTGIQALRDAGGVKEGSSVLVIGASGGCGLAGVQLAKAMGATRVVGICSGKNAELVTTNGANEVVDYTDSAALSKFLDANKGKFDCVYDTATGSGGGEAYTKASIPLLASGSGYAQINGGLSTWVRGLSVGLPKGKSLVVTSPNSRSNLEEIVSLLKKTGAKPNMNIKGFSESEIKEGFDLLKSRRTRGKVVFHVSKQQG